MTMIPPKITEAIEHLQQQHFTGSLTLHFSEGRFKLAEEKRSWKPECEPIDKDRATTVASA